MYLNAHEKLCFLRKRDKLQTGSSGLPSACADAVRFQLRVRAVPVPCWRRWHSVINPSLPDRGSGVHGSFVTCHSTFLSPGYFWEFCLGFRVAEVLLPRCPCCLAPVSCCFGLLLTFCSTPHPFFYKTYGTNQLIGKELMTVLTHTRWQFC